MNWAASISAEHGIGRLKVKDLERYKRSANCRPLHAIQGGVRTPKGSMNSRRDVPRAGRKPLGRAVQAPFECGKRVDFHALMASSRFTPAKFLAGR